MDQNEFERESMIVGSRTMSREDYKKTSLYRWIFMFAHYLGYTQYIARFISNHKNISYKSFYTDFMNFCENSTESNFLKKEISETDKSLSIFLSSKGPMGRVLDKIRPNFAWDYEEATAINIVESKDIFYTEVKSFLKNYDVDEEIVDDLIEYQKDTIIDPTNKYPLKKTYNYNFYEMINYSAKLKKKSQTYLIEGKNYNADIFEWGKETLWWGRRVAACKAKIKNINKSAMTYNVTEINPEIFDKR